MARYNKNYDQDPASNVLGSIIWVTIMQIFWIIIALIAIYYSFKLNGGMSWSILLAIFFSPIYLVYGVYKIGFPPSVTINH